MTMSKNLSKILCVVLLVMALCLAACDTPGKNLGALWVAHNSTTAIVTELGSGEEPVLSLSELKEFQSYQIPVKVGLDEATADFLEGNDIDVMRTIEYLDPMIERMIELSEVEE